MKKPGQPDSALILTAGRKSLLGQLRYGVADRAAQSMAANWLRDLTVHHGESLRRLELNATYNALMTGTLNNAAQQGLAVDWIEGLLFTAQENATMPDQPTANETQVGGAHYAKPIQHWDFVSSHDYGYLEGQITKYLFRWRDKNGLQDVQKAAHFLQKLGEVTREELEPVRLQDFLEVNNIPEIERSIFIAIHAYHGTLDPVFLDYARDAMRRLLVQAGSATP